MSDENGAAASPGEDPGEVKFAHESEAEFARFLTFHRIAWQYEPRTFVLEEDDDGNIKKGFSPDFYLPDFDLYVELTTKKPHLMSRKLRQIEALADRYPRVRVQLLDRADYRTFLYKHGRSPQQG